MWAVLICLGLLTPSTSRPRSCCLRHHHSLPLGGHGAHRLLLLAGGEAGVGHAPSQVGELVSLGPVDRVDEVHELAERCARVRVVQKHGRPLHRDRDEAPARRCPARASGIRDDRGAIILAVGFFCIEYGRVAERYRRQGERPEELVRRLVKSPQVLRCQMCYAT